MHSWEDSGIFYRIVVTTILNKRKHTTQSGWDTVTEERKMGAREIELDTTGKRGGAQLPPSTVTTQMRSFHPEATPKENWDLPTTSLLLETSVVLLSGSQPSSP
ncbi:uncharacterized protein LOC144198314 [Stigmatopora nigra]